MMFDVPPDITQKKTMEPQSHSFSGRFGINEQKVVTWSTEHCDLCIWPAAILAIFSLQW
jgi:hypothetical protein